MEDQEIAIEDQVDEVEEIEVAEETVIEEDVRFDAEEVFHRSIEFDERSIDIESRRVKIALSSEAPVERSFGTEILDHGEKSIDMQFLASGRAPLLIDHDHTKVVGVIEDVSLDGRCLRALARFGKSGLANEIFSDVENGIRSNISIGYRINKMSKDSDGSYRAMSWTPLEASFVSVPADTSVGLGRSEQSNFDTTEPKPQIQMETKVMSEELNLDAVRDEAARRAAKDTAEMYRLAEKHNKRHLADEAVKEGKSLTDFCIDLARELPGGTPLETAEVGLSKKEVRNFSLLRAVRAMANPSDRQAQRAAEFEFEVSAAAQNALGREARGLMIPDDILGKWSKRDLNTSDDSSIIAEDFRGGDFIDVLRNASSVMAAGATMLQGLKGSVAIPKKTAASTAGWIATEGGAASESEPTFGQVVMVPKVVGSTTDITRLMLQQSSPDIEALIRNDLSAGIALAIDDGALEGSGSSGQPTGIKNTSGINAPTSFAGVNPTFAEVVAMETAVAEDNALIGNLAYILPASMYGALKTTAKDSGSGQFVVEPGGTINGYRAIVSNQVTAGDLYFGNFRDLLLGFYGGLDITVDPYSSSNTGTVRIVALQTCDVAVRHAVSFAVNNDGA
jgi:HK97 family phage major capsid protein